MSEQCKHELCNVIICIGFYRSRIESQRKNDRKIRYIDTFDNNKNMLCYYTAFFVYDPTTHLPLYHLKRSYCLRARTSLER